MEPSAAASAALDARDDLNDRDRELLLTLTPAERRTQARARELVLDHLTQIGLRDWQEPLIVRSVFPASVGS
ncbi:hypothetical protein GCM10022221_14530 [Actinocorallia aurea]